jgi:polygalacturonase
MNFRREFLKSGAAGLFAVAGAAAAPASNDTSAGASRIFDVRAFGATGNGSTIETAAVNRAIDAAAAAGGGTVWFGAGSYACYSIRLKSKVTLQLEPGATIVAAEVPLEGTTSGYDPAEPNEAGHDYQDFGHLHWHNSLIWGEELHDVAILGRGLIWGKGLSRGTRDPQLPRAELPGVGNKAIALKNCRNVLLRDFAVLNGGHFAVLATGVDNFSIDNLTIDTNRDGIDLDCCRNVRVSNCTVNSPYDDAICPKSSFALGNARATENVTITNCFVSGSYVVGTVMDGTWQKYPTDARVPRTGRIKFGTESNGGFKNITVSNCVFDGCNGIALESVDGGLLEDVTFTGLTMRDISHAPIFMRLGNRMRGPQGVPVGSLRRVILSNIVSYNAASDLCAIISGIPGHMIEDVKINDVYLHHRGGGTAEMAALKPEEFENKYPEPTMFGKMPAHGFFLRHVNNIEFTNVEIAYEQRDARPAVVLANVQGADFFRLKTPGAAPAPIFSLADVSEFRTIACREVKDISLSLVEKQDIPPSRSR